MVVLSLWGLAKNRLSAISSPAFGLAFLELSAVESDHDAVQIGYHELSRVATALSTHARGVRPANAHPYKGLELFDDPVMRQGCACKNNACMGLDYRDDP